MIAQHDSMLDALGRQWGNSPWYLSSAGIHSLIFALMLLFAPEPKPDKARKIEIKTSVEKEDLEAIKDEPKEKQVVEEDTKAEVNLNDIAINTTFDAPAIDMAMAVDLGNDIGGSAGRGDSTSFNDGAIGDTSSNLAVPAQTGALRGAYKVYNTRGGKAKRAAIKKRGGDALSEEAVDRGLAWMARNQQSDGSWLMKPLFPNEKTHKRLKTNSGLTALCMLAYLGAGNTSTIGKYARNVNKAEEYLLKFKYSEAGRVIPAPVGFDAPLMLMALAESCGMGNKDKDLKKKIESLIDLGVSSQLTNGGWPEDFIDREGGWHNTTWWLCALKAARQADFKVPDEVFEKTVELIYKSIKYEGNNKLFANIAETPGSPRQEGGTVGKMVASMAVYALQSIKSVGLEDERIKAICHLMADAGTNRNGVYDWPGANIGLYDSFARGTAEHGATYLPEWLERPNANQGVKPPAGLSPFFARSALGFPLGQWGKPGFLDKFDEALKNNRIKVFRSWYGACYWYWQGYSYSRLGEDTDYWKAWNANFKPYLIYTQARGKAWPSTVTIDTRIKPETGDLDGSWPGAFLRDGCEPFDEMGQAAATAFCCMMLEVYYRY